jgi:two-component system, cell cycle sensor histidine kinase and response regulator CckA
MVSKPTYEELEQRNKELTDIVAQQEIIQKLHRIQLDLSNSLYESENLEQGLSLCLDAAIETSGMDCGGIYLFDDATQDLRLMFQKGLPSSFIESVSTYRPNSEHIELIRKGEPIYSNHHDLDLPLTDDKKNERLCAIAIISISDKNKVVGCMNVASHTIDDVPEVSRYSLEAITPQIGSAIKRMKIEQALFEEEQRFAAFFESIPIGTIMSNSPSEPFTVNTAFADILGYSKEELQTMSAVETGKMITHPVDFKEELKRYLNYNFGETNRHRIEKRFIKKNGDIITADVSTSFIVSDDGNLILAMSAVVGSRIKWWSQQRHFQSN